MGLVRPPRRGVWDPPWRVARATGRVGPAVSRRPPKVHAWCCSLPAHVFQPRGVLVNPSDSERIETGPLPTAAVFASCEYDFQSGRFSWTDRAESLFGTVPRTVDAFLEHVQAEERAGVEHAWRALSDRGTHDFEYPCIHLDGALRWHAWYGRPMVDPAGRARGLSALVLDVTTRRTTERAQLEELAGAQAARDQAEGALRATSPSRRWRTISRPRSRRSSAGPARSRPVARSRHGGAGDHGHSPQRGPRPGSSTTSSTPSGWPGGSWSSGASG